MYEPRRATSEQVRLVALMDHTKGEERLKEEEVYIRSQWYAVHMATRLLPNDMMSCIITIKTVQSVPTVTFFTSVLTASYCLFCPAVGHIERIWRPKHFLWEQNGPIKTIQHTHSMV